MKNRKSKWVLFGGAALLLCAALLLSSPRLRVRAFVAMHGEQLETSLAQGMGIPTDLGIDTFNTWEGEHSMTEFILLARGNSYYGCYYSPDDVPLSFQNAGEELTQESQICWEWQGEGDNHGVTEKLENCWYYFEASF